jgi:purine nucleosidase
MTSLIVAASLLAGPDETPHQRTPVVLTTDCGTEVDDQWALVHLALSPAIDLKGVVTTHAPGMPAPATAFSAKVAREWLGRLRLHEEPEVYPGSSQPLADKVHPHPNAGVRFLIEQSRGHSADDRLTVLVIGAATDVASALLVEPSLADRIAIVAMGFEAWPRGGDPWNVKNDVKAWQVLLESRATIVVGDCSVTRRDLAMSAAKAHSLLDGAGETGRALVALLEGWLKEHGALAKSETGSPASWPIWDEVAVAYLLGLARVEGLPRPALRDDMTFDHAKAHGTIEWVRSVDSDRLWADLVARLKGRDGG